MTENNEKYESVSVGKVKGVKPLDKKYEKTLIENVNSSDFYCEIKVIPMPKEKLTRTGENGLNVPPKYFPTKMAKLSAETAKSLFKRSHSFTFNMSNRYPNEPVTCIARFGNEDSLFINLHQNLDVAPTHKFNRLCYDRSTIRIGHHLVNLEGEALEELIIQCELLFSSYKSNNSEEQLIQYFSPKKPLYLLSKIFSSLSKLFRKKNTSEVPKQDVSEVTDDFVNSYFVKEKKINVINVYP